MARKNSNVTGETPEERAAKLKLQKSEQNKRSRNAREVITGSVANGTNIAERIELACKANGIPSQSAYVIKAVEQALTHDGYPAPTQKED